jgi:hypothetical protein
MATKKGDVSKTDQSVDQGNIVTKHTRPIEITLEEDIWHMIEVSHFEYKQTTQTDISLDEYVSLKLRAPYLAARKRIENEAKFQAARGNGVSIYR